jgi:hypothetical protein
MATMAPMASLVPFSQFDLVSPMDRSCHQSITNGTTNSYAAIGSAMHRRPPIVSNESQLSQWLPLVLLSMDRNCSLLLLDCSK